MVPAVGLEPTRLSTGDFESQNSGLHGYIMVYSCLNQQFY